MLKNYITIAIRNLWKNKVFFIYQYCRTHAWPGLRYTYHFVCQG